MNNRIYTSEVFAKEMNRFLRNNRRFCPECFSDETHIDFHWTESLHVCKDCGYTDKKFLDLESMRKMKIKEILK